MEKDNKTRNEIDKLMFKLEGDFKMMNHLPKVVEDKIREGKFVEI